MTLRLPSVYDSIIGLLDWTWGPQHLWHHAVGISANHYIGAETKGADTLQIETDPAQRTYLDDDCISSQRLGDTPASHF